jgi:hypothetical protein
MSRVVACRPAEIDGHVHVPLSDFHRPSPEPGADRSRPNISLASGMRTCI